MIPFEVFTQLAHTTGVRKVTDKQKKGHLILLAQREMTFMVIHDFVMPQTCNTKLLHGLCRYLLLLKSYLAINDYFVFLFRGVWRPDLLLFVFLCICFLVPLDLLFSSSGRTQWLIKDMRAFFIIATYHMRQGICDYHSRRLSQVHIQSISARPVSLSMFEISLGS